MRLYFDTSVLVSLAVAHHPHHDLAYTAFRQATTGSPRGLSFGTRPGGNL